MKKKIITNPMSHHFRISQKHWYANIKKNDICTHILQNKEAYYQKNNTMGRKKFTAQYIFHMITIMRKMQNEVWSFEWASSLNLVVFPSAPPEGRFLATGCCLRLSADHRSRPVGSFRGNIFEGIRSIREKLSVEKVRKVAFFIVV